MTQQAVRQFVYYTSSGYITAVKTIQEGLAEVNAPFGESWLQHSGAVRSDTHYVAHPGDAGANVGERPRMNLTVSPQTFNVSGEFVVSGVPPRSVLYHPEGRRTIDQGTAEWSTNTAGVYTLQLKCWPYVDEEWHIQVTP